jgi:hypothetical protein
MAVSAWINLCAWSHVHRGGLGNPLIVNFSVRAAQTSGARTPRAGERPIYPPVCENSSLAVSF